VSRAVCLRSGLIAGGVFQLSRGSAVIKRS